VSSKSFKPWFDERLRDRHIPQWLRDRLWEAIFGKDFGLLKSLLDAAGFSGAEKRAVLERGRNVAQTLTRYASARDSRRDQRMYIYIREPKSRGFEGLSSVGQTPRRTIHLQFTLAKKQRIAGGASSVHTNSSCWMISRTLSQRLTGLGYPWTNLHHPLQTGIIPTRRWRSFTRQPRAS
jgi:hypothetical protein